MGVEEGFFVDVRPGRGGYVASVEYRDHDGVWRKKRLGSRYASYEAAHADGMAWMYEYRREVN